MAYNKPGIEVSQIQERMTPTLFAPDLEAVVIGESNYWQPMTEATGTYLTAAQTEIAVSGINSEYPSVEGHENLVLVDLLTATGVRKPLVKTTDFTIATENELSTITILSGIQVDSANITTAAAVYVGYRADNISGRGFKTLESLSDIQNLYGSTNSWNPLAYGATLAMANAGATINVYGISGVTSAANVLAALGDLEAREVYAMSLLEQKYSASNTAGYLSTHVTTQSSAINKKERIAFVCKATEFNGTAYYEDSTQKVATATAVQLSNVAHANKRLFSIHPDTVYVDETRHISTINPTWIAASFLNTAPTVFGLGDRVCLFRNNVKINNIAYLKGQKITAAIYAAIKDYITSEDKTLSVWAPVPGYYQTAAIVGQVVGKTPEQPLTNVPISGFAKTKGSNDYFSEANLNTMAEGGTYIINELTTNTLVCRHQVATDMSSVAKRELSVTTALDFTAKFIRTAFSPYIGRYTISPSFIKLANTILVGIGMYLRREGYINDLQVLSITQDSINPDTLLVEVNILVKYPVNYIKLKLIF